MVEPIIESKIVVWEDLGYTAKLTNNSGYHMQFTIYAIELFGPPHSYGRKTWVGYTENLDEARISMTGYVKWDHCMNLDFDEDEGSFHFCSKEQAMRLGILMERL